MYSRQRQWKWFHQIVDTVGVGSLSVRLSVRHVLFLLDCGFII